MARRRNRRREPAEADGRSGTRRAVAATAARMLATGEEMDMGSAKRRALELHGSARRNEQPSNVEIHDALSEYLRIFEPEELAARLGRLRTQAVQAMIYLEAFKPRLVGPVLHGTACAYTPVTLHVFCDEAEAVLRSLFALGVRVDTDEREVRYPDGSYRPRVVYSFERDDVDFDLIVMPEIETRSPPVSGIDGKPALRATLAEVKGLLEATPASA